jgi:hypothetical protein
VDKKNPVDTTKETVKEVKVEEDAAKKMEEACE